MNFPYFFAEKKKLKSCFDPLTVTCSVSFQKTESSSSACSTSSSQRTTCGASLSPSAASRNAPSSEVPTATAKVSLCSCLPLWLGRGCFFFPDLAFQTLETFARFSFRRAQRAPPKWAVLPVVRERRLHKHAVGFVRLHSKMSCHTLPSG